MYRKDAAFYVVYIREAHPKDGSRPLSGELQLSDPKSFFEREEVARKCAGALRFSMPMLVDEIDDGAAKAYGAYPDRIYIVGKDGRVVYQGGPGPRGFRPDEMETALKKLLAEKPVEKPRRARV